MKKIIIAGSALLVILAGCSKSRTETQQAVNEEAWVNDESLPVPVEFSSTGLNVETKALIEGESMDGQEIGVFALRNTPVPGTSWTYDDNWGTNGDGVLFANLKASIEDAAVTFDETQYYPMSGDDGYSFFAYAPYDASAGVVGNNGYYVTYNLQDAVDILWCEEHPGYVYGSGTIFGFNAKYIRSLKKTAETHPTHNDYLPELKFKHMLTALRFYAVSTSDESNITVTALSIKGVPTRATLEIAGRADHVSGELTGSMVGTLNLLDTEYSSSDLNVTPSVAGTEMGTMLICPVDNVSQPTINVDVTLKVGDGEPVTLQNQVMTVPSDGGFKAQSRYSIKLLIKDAESIDLTATLDKWIDEDDVTVDINN